MSQTRETKLLELTLGQILDRAIAQEPDREAMVYVDREFRLTYRELGEVVDTLAKGLMALGVGVGEKVAVWANNVPHWVALQFATAKIGAVLLTVNTHYKRAELDYLLRQSEAENLFIIEGYRDTDYLGTVYDLIPELRTQARGFLDCERYPRLKRVFFLDQDKHRGLYSLPEVMALGRMVTDEEYLARQAELDQNQVVNMQYTSGTTGLSQRGHADSPRYW